MWAPRPTPTWLSWKTQCGLSLAHLKEKWDNWTTGQMTNTLFVVENMAFLWNLEEKSQTAPPDTRDVDLVTVLTDVTRVSHGCFHSCPEKSQLFPFTKTQAGIEITCDIPLRRHWAEQENEGGVGKMKRKCPNMDFILAAFFPPMCPIVESPPLLMRAATTQTDPHTQSQKHFIT